MALKIRNSEAERLARTLARVTGETVTDAVTTCASAFSVFTSQGCVEIAWQAS